MTAIHPKGDDKRQDTRVTELERNSQIRPPLTHLSEGNQVDIHCGASESAAISTNVSYLHQQHSEECSWGRLCEVLENSNFSPTDVKTRWSLHPSRFSRSSQSCERASNHTKKCDQFEVVLNHFLALCGVAFHNNSISRPSSRNVIRRLHGEIPRLNQ